MILVGLLLIALLLMAKGHDSPQEVIYGSSFHQKGVVFESQFLHYNIPLNLEEQLNLAYNIHKFYKSRNLLSPISGTAFLHRLKRISRSYKLKLQESQTSSLSSIQKQVLPYIEGRRPLSIRTTDSPPTVGGLSSGESSENSDHDTSDTDILSGILSDSEYDAMGLGLVPTDPTLNITANETESTTAGASSDLQPSGLYDHDSTQEIFRTTHGSS